MELVEKTFEGVGKMALNPRDLVSREQLLKGNWEGYHDSYYAKYITKDMNAIDCGAHVGTKSIKMANHANAVYSFEPFYLSYQNLCINSSLNPNLNIIPLNLGLADKKQLTRYSWVCEGNFGASGLEISCDNEDDFVKGCRRATRADRHQQVLTMALDDLNIPNIGFIKIDTEGCEQLVVKGAMRTIKENRPFLIVELNGQKNVDAIREIFEPMDYEMTFIHGHDYFLCPIEKLKTDD